MKKFSTETECVYCVLWTGYIIYGNYFRIIKSSFQIMRFYNKDKSQYCSPFFMLLLSPFWRLHQQTHCNSIANRTSSQSLWTLSRLKPILLCFKLSKLLLHAYCLLLLMEPSEHRTKCTVQQPFTVPTDSVQWKVQWTLPGVRATDWMVSVHNTLIQLVVCR